MTPPPFQPDVPLAPLTTLGVGGPARAFARGSTAQLPELLDRAHQQQLPVLLLGGGSNLLVADAGWPGLALQLDDSIRSVARDGQHVEVTVGAGAVWDELVAWSTAQGLAGIECLSGIPGHVGAAPMQNIGAYGQEVGERLVRVECVEVATGSPRTLAASECGLGYRTSRFKHAEAGRWIVTAVTLRLTPGGPASLRYAELARRAEALGPAPDLSAVRRLVLAIRKSKSMVLDPDDPDARSAGSFFTNPIVPPATAEQVRAAAAARGIEGMPSWDVPGGVKLAAAWLIERSGFARGWGDGPAGLSSKHTLAIVNRGAATAADVVGVAASVRAGVYDCFGVQLVPEPVFVGFDSTDPAEILDAAASPTSPGAK